MKQDDRLAVNHTSEEEEEQEELNCFAEPV